MIATAAPPVLHHTQHENGGSDEIDATGLTGASGGSQFPQNVISIGSFMESIDCWDSNTTGSGNVNAASDGINIRTNTTANSTASINRNAYISNADYSWDNDHQFDFTGFLRSNTTNTCLFYILHGTDETTDAIGFKVLNGQLFGYVHDGVSATTLLLETISASSFNVKRALRAVFTAGANCKFYVDGVLLGTISTGLPTGIYSSDNLVFISVANPSVAELKYITISSFNVIINP